MTDYAEIADRAVEIIGSPDVSQYLTAFNAMKSDIVDRDIPTAGIKKYLILTDKWLPIKSSPEMAAVVAMDALSIFDSFNFTDPVTGPAVKMKLGAMMSALISAGLIDETNKATIMAMGSQTRMQAGLTDKQVQNALDMRARGDI